MADTDTASAKSYQVDVPAQSQPFFLKGSDNLDWGMKNRLSNIFSPESGRTVMLAFDHGYFLGPTSGLERIDLDIVPLTPFADTLMLTRGILRSCIPPIYTGGIVLRASGGPSILKELSDEQIAISIDEAVRLNAAAMAVQVFIGGENETQSIHNMTRLVDMGIEPYLVASSLELVMAQRLVRLICPECREELPAAEVDRLRVEFGADVPDRLYRGLGCRECQDTGYSGRQGIFEMMPVSEEIQTLVLNSCSANQIRKIAVRQGMVSLRQDGGLRESRTAGPEGTRRGSLRANAPTTSGR